MRFRFIWIGKTKDKHWKALQEDYLKRLSHFVKYDIVEIKDPAKHETKEEEGKRILTYMNQSFCSVLLDITYESLSSHELSGLIDKWQIQGKKEITFIIGGYEGVSADIDERASFRLSLSYRTF